MMLREYQARVGEVEAVDRSGGRAADRRQRRRHAADADGAGGADGGRAGVGAPQSATLEL